MLRVKDPVIHHHVMQHGPESPWPSCNGRTRNAVSMSMSSKLITMARSRCTKTPPPFPCVEFNSVADAHSEWLCLGLIK